MAHAGGPGGDPRRAGGLDIRHDAYDDGPRTASDAVASLYFQVSHGVRTKSPSLLQTITTAPSLVAPSWPAGALSAATVSSDALAAAATANTFTQQVEGKPSVSVGRGGVGRG